MKAHHVLVVVLALFWAVLPASHAQWVQTNGPYGGSVFSLAISDTNLFAGTTGGVFLSTNNGTSWTVVNTGLTNLVVRSLVTRGTNLFAGTNGGVYLSTNNGTSWTAVNSGLTIPYVSALAVSGTSLFAGTFLDLRDGSYAGGVYRSTDNGTTWTVVLPLRTGGFPPRGGWSLVTGGTNLFAGGFGIGVYRSNDSGTNWAAANTGLPNPYVTSLATNGTNLFAGTLTNFYLGGILIDGVFLSTDNGTSWTAVNAGLPNATVSALATSNTTLFAGTDGSGVFLTTNSGAIWTAVNSGLGNLNILCLAVSDGYLYAGTGTGVWRRPLAEMITSVEPLTGQVPQELELHQNYPNPFNPSTTITYELPKSSVVRLSVYDMLGREVSVLVNEKRDAGVHEVKFDGWNLASGVYFYRLQAGDFVQSKKLIIVK